MSGVHIFVLGRAFEVNQSNLECILQLKQETETARTSSRNFAMGLIFLLILEHHGLDVILDIFQDNPTSPHSASRRANRARVKATVVPAARVSDRGQGAGVLDQTAPNADR